MRKFRAGFHLSYTLFVCFRVLVRSVNIFFGIWLWFWGGLGLFLFIKWENSKAQVLKLPSKVVESVVLLLLSYSLTFLLAGWGTLPLHIRHMIAFLLCWTHQRYLTPLSHRKVWSGKSKLLSISQLYKFRGKAPFRPCPSNYARVPRPKDDWCVSHIHLAGLHSNNVHWK